MKRIAIWAALAAALVAMFALPASGQIKAGLPGVTWAAPSSAENQTPWLPDHKLTPGAFNPDITQQNIGSNICKKGWSTSSLRPSTSYTNKIKAEKMAAQGLRGDTHQFELDHLVPIEDGGDPRSPDNLWAEPWNLNVNGYDLGAHTKDKAENATHAAICDGRISLDEARKQMAADWTVLFKEFVSPEFPPYSGPPKGKSKAQLSPDVHGRGWRWQMDWMNYLLIEHQQQRLQRAVILASILASVTRLEVMPL
ncbi:MAG: hypothetical protein ACREDR_00075 [Blastocatellia bacterium]